MRGTFVPALLALAFASSAQAKIAPPAPIPLRVAMSDTVVVGKVTAIEEKTVKAERFPGDKEMGEFQVAVVKVDDRIAGAKDLTHVKVGFMPGGGGPRGRSMKLAKDEEVLLFLSPHSSGAFHRTRDFRDAIRKDSDEFAASVKEAKAAAKLLADPMAILKNKDSKDRILVALLLVSRYRDPQEGHEKQEPIPAEESKLILQALADADWMGRGFGGYQLTAQHAFHLLQLTPEDGFNPDKDDFKNLAENSKKWLKANAEKYRIKRFTAGKSK